MAKPAEEDLVYRNGAKEGNLVCVTGDLGGAYLGLQILEREKRIYLEHPEVQPELENADYLIGRQLKPEARKDVLQFFKDMNLKPTAMMDLSDGTLIRYFSPLQTKWRWLRAERSTNTRKRRAYTWL